MTDYPSECYEIAIGLIPGIGAKNSRMLAIYCGGVKNVFTASKAKLKSVPNIGDGLTKVILEHKEVCMREALKIFEKATKNQTKIIFFSNPEYPQVLKNFDDSPVLLYWRGSMPLSHMFRSVAIVGTRNATTYGKEVVEQIVKALAPYRPVIISGLAYGIDIAAHKAALKYGLKTIAVMGTGPDIIYPSVHKSIASEIMQQGGLLTEYSFGTKPDPHHFPERNRIVAALADATVVIEASDKGGALITAELANGYHKEVYAIPGRIADTYSTGCNQLILQNKARILVEPTALAEDLGWNKTELKMNLHNLAEIADKKITLQLSDEASKVYDTLKQYENLVIDDLAWKTGLNVNKLSSVLLEMEFEGMIKALPGKKFKLNP